MKRLFLVFIVVALTLPQAGQAGWWRTYGGMRGDCIHVASDGNYIISGVSQGGGLWLLKTDTSGNILWSRICTTTGGDYSRWLEQTADGGYVVAAWSPSLVKTDSQGDTMWTRNYGIYTYCVQVVSDGEYIVTGGDHGNDYDSKLILVKTNSQGDTLWTKSCLESGNNKNVGYFIQKTNDNGFIITGLTGYVDDYVDYSNLWVLKTDANGNKQWSKTFGEGIGHCVKQTTDGGYIVTGFKSSTNALWLLKTDATGDTIWTRTYATSTGGRGLNVSETSDSGYIVTGVTVPMTLLTSPQYGDLWLLKTDSNGDSLWSRLYGEEGSDVGECVEPTSDGGYMVAGSTSSFDSGKGLLLLKTDSLGFLGITEKPINNMSKNWHVVSSLGFQVKIRYSDRPQGFEASVFNTAGQKVDEIHGDATSGTISWGNCFPQGAYFIQVKETNYTHAEHVVIIR